MTLKEQLVNLETVTILVNAINEYYPIESSKFIDEVVQEIPKLELMERIAHISVLLDKYMSGDFIADINVFKAVMEKAEPRFIYAAVLEYLERNGCTDEFIDLSLKMMPIFTRVFSAELIIRRFLNKYPNQTLEHVREWSLSDSIDTRRLASEGVRPKLPWAKKINIDYLEGCIQLDNLFYDDSRYVTRSVANHLNDISKMDPEFVVDKLKVWKESSKQKDSEMKYIINHSLRGLIKKGNKMALSFLGYSENPDVEVSNYKADDFVKIGNMFSFSFDIVANSSCSLVVDYVVHYQSKSGRPSKKVYKIKSADFKDAGIIRIEKKHLFKQRTTRELFKGTHKLSVQLNGKIYIEREFEII